MDTAKAYDSVKRAFNLASNIYVKGEEAKLMAMALQNMENALKDLEDPKEGESNG